MSTDIIFFIFFTLHLERSTCSVEKSAQISCSRLSFFHGQILAHVIPMVLDTGITGTMEKTSTDPPRNNESALAFALLARHRLSHDQNHNMQKEHGAPLYAEQDTKKPKKKKDLAIQTDLQKLISPVSSVHNHCFESSQIGETKSSSTSPT